MDSFQYLPLRIHLYLSKWWTYSTEETMMDKSDKESCGCKKEHVKGHKEGHWHGEGPHEWDVDKLKEKLGLTDEQVAELKGLREQKKELRRQYKEAKEKGDNEAIAKVKAQKEELWKQMKGILKK